MKVQIDTELKTIKLEKSENLGKIFDLLERMVENWREYTLELVDIVIVQNIPSIVYVDRPYWPNYIPIQYPFITNPTFTSAGINTASGGVTNRIINNTGTHTLDLE